VGSDSSQVCTNKGLTLMKSIACQSMSIGTSCADRHEARHHTQVKDHHHSLVIVDSPKADGAGRVESNQKASL
jgi:hypothetical protein